MAAAAVPVEVSRARRRRHVRAIALDGKCLRTKCEQNHDLGYEMLKRFAQIIEQRLEATRFQLLDVYAVPGDDHGQPQPQPIRCSRSRTGCGKWSRRRRIPLP